MPTTIPKLHAPNLVPVGERFVALALGDPKVEVPAPEDGADFLRAMGVVVPQRYTKVYFHRNSLTELNFMIPTKELVEEVLALIPGSDDLYDRAIYQEYQRIADGTTTMSREDQFYFRVGDYSIAHCK